MSGLVAAQAAGAAIAETGRKGHCRDTRLGSGLEQVARYNRCAATTTERLVQLSVN